MIINNVSMGPYRLPPAINAHKAAMALWHFVTCQCVSLGVSGCMLSGWMPSNLIVDNELQQTLTACLPKLIISVVQTSPNVVETQI